MKKQAVVYIRVSTEEQALHGTSPDVQRDAGLAMAAQMGAQVVDICPDLGVSGARYSSRPGIQKALKAIEAGEANILIATKIDRIGRSAAVILDIVERVRKAGGEIVTNDARFDNTPMGQFTLTMFAGMAELERNNIKERTKSGAVARANEGLQPMRSRSPFGLHVVTTKEKARGLYPEVSAGIYLLTDQSPLVAEMFRRYAAGESLREVCRWLNQEGIQTQFGGQYWRPSQLKKLLVNPVYMGKATYGKHARHTEEVGTKTMVHLTIRDTFLSIDAPAIVSEELWNTCQTRLGEARAVFGGNPTRRHLLGGLLRCPLCGRGMHGTKRNKPTHQGRNIQFEHLYRCPDNRPSRNAGGIVCNPKGYSGAEAEQIATRAIMELSGKPEIITKALRAYRKAEEAAYDPQALGRVETALRALEMKERATVDAQVAGIQAGANPAAYAAAFAKIAEERVALLARRRDLTTQNMTAQEATREDDAVLRAKAMQDVERVLTSAELADGEKHDVLALVLEKMVPEGEGTYRMHLKGLDGVEKGHNISMLWPPAAATSRARLTCS